MADTEHVAEIRTQWGAVDPDDDQVIDFRDDEEDARDWASHFGTALKRREVTFGDWLDTPTTTH